MSILWDERRRSPQLWTYPVFILLTVGLCVGVYMYGLKKASEMPDAAVNEKTQNPR